MKRKEKSFFKHVTQITNFHKIQTFKVQNKSFTTIKPLFLYKMRQSIFIMKKSTTDRWTTIKFKIIKAILEVIGCINTSNIAPEVSWATTIKPKHMV